ncbi:hypothetical protein [Natrialba taiwanensis]|nr:hypothetical protein [Natrialba taiwanensis]
MSRKDRSNGDEEGEPTNSDHERTLLGRRDWLKLSGAAVGIPLAGAGNTAAQPSAGASAMQRKDEYLNLASEVPQQAMDLWNRQPDDYQAAFPTEDVTSYAGRSGDLADAIETASENGAIANLGSNNEYELESMATAPGSHFGVIGDNCTIYFNRNDTPWMLQPNCDVGVVKGVTFDISEHSDSSSAVLGGNFNEEFWAEDVELVGERNKGEDAGRIYTWRPHMTNENAEGLVENLRMADGDYYSGSGTPPDGTRAIAVSADPGHVGYLAYKDCHMENWTSSGYYMSCNPHDGPGGGGSGEALLWNCTAINNHRGNMRIGLNDKIVGGYIDLSDMPDGLQGQGVVCEYATGDANNPTEIIGLRSGGNDYAREAVVCRNFYYNRGDTAHVRYKKLVLEASGKQPPASIRPGTNPPNNSDAELSDGVEAEFEDVYLYDDYPSDRYNGLLEIQNDADVFTEQFRALSEANPEVNVHSGGSFTYGGTTYGSGEYTAGQLGFDDPRTDYDGLPEFYFDYGDGGGGGSEWLDLGTDDDQSSVSNESGVLFWLKEDLGAIEARLSQHSAGHQTAYLRDTNTDIVTQTDISDLSPGETFVLSPDGGIEGASSYSVTVDANGEYWDRGENSSPNYDYENGTFQVTAGVYTSSHSTTQNVRYAVSEIAGREEGTGSNWLDLGSDNDQSNPDTESGVLFWLKEDIDGIEAQISQNTAEHQTAYLRDSGANIVAQTDISGLSSGETFVLSPAGGIEGSNTYSVTVDADGGHWLRGEDSDPNYEYENETFRVTDGVYTSGQSTTKNVRYAVSDIRDS